ncbi:putative F-box domain-containing protein [Helianthus anomalus]
MWKFSFTRSSGYNCYFTSVGMVTTRSMSRKQKKSSNSDDHTKGSWISFNDDLVFLILMHLEVFDYVALSGVCKAWRSFAISNWNKFMMSKQPMYLSISSDFIFLKDCYIQDHTRRKLKAIIPHSSARKCIGVTCGYLIFFERKTHGFWLVNPFTRKELHFPDFSDAMSASKKGILVYSHAMSGWVFVIITYQRNSTGFAFSLAFSLAGKQSEWRYISCNTPILDLHFFKGKIYTLHTMSQLYEFRLNPVPTFIPQKMKNFSVFHVRYRNFISSGEKLYVMTKLNNDFDTLEVDFDEMRWANSERTIAEYKLFLSDLKCDAAIRPDPWAHPSLLQNGV